VIIIVWCHGVREIRLQIGMLVSLSGGGIPLPYLACCNSFVYPPQLILSQGNFDFLNAFLPGFTATLFVVTFSSVNV
jgi:hypothetical protein